MDISINKGWIDQFIGATDCLLHQDVVDLLSNGFVLVDGMVFLLARAKSVNIKDLRCSMDETAIESFVNSIHLSDYGQVRMSANSFFAIAALVRVQVQLLPRRTTLRAVLSGLGEDVVFRVFSIRADQPWLSDDIDTYGEPIFSVDFRGCRE